LKPGLVDAVVIVPRRIVEVEINPPNAFTESITPRKSITIQ